jgi:hypothetical protein
MAGFRPGTSPPPVRIPITPFLAFTVIVPCGLLIFHANTNLVGFVA